MAEVTYVGIHDAVDVPMPLGGWQTVVKGAVLSTDDEHAKGLLLQPSNWKSASSAPKPEAVKPEPDNGKVTA